MANLSAPSVGEPLYECASTIAVYGYVPGGTIDIYAGPAVRIGGGVSNSPSGQVFGIAAANVVAGARITATQSYAGDTSPPSPAVLVHFYDSVCILADPAPTISRTDQQRVAKAYVTAFFRRYLHGSAEVEDYLTGARAVEELEGVGVTVDAQV